MGLELNHYFGERRGINADSNMKTVRSSEGRVRPLVLRRSALSTSCYSGIRYNEFVCAFEVSAFPSVQAIWQAAHAQASNTVRPHTSSPRVLDAQFRDKFQPFLHLHVTARQCSTSSGYLH
jgi:hypothetical protein